MNTTEAWLPQNRLKYRADIDGLRAVAVLSVLAFHMGLLKIPGGFVGVDVFFVISGYLISFIVFSEISASKYSIVSFYERRIRRIFPALFAMLAVFTFFAFFYLMPNELADYGKSLAATTNSAGNFYFWLHSGYFDAPTSNPLLHTWSLGVEEQFYIVFPIFLIVVRRFFPTRLRAAVVVLFFASLAASAWVVLHHPTTAFYMLYTRAWELLLGTALSLGMFPRFTNPIGRNIATAVGISLIAYADLFYSPDTLFPGLSALVPCLGSALIIGAGESGPSLVGSVLSWKPIVFVGLISYSLYLWHWPVVVVQNLGVFGPMQHGIVAIASLLLGFLSWRFIELPFRNGPLRMSGAPLFASAAGVMLVFLGLSVFLIVSHGVPGRFPARAEQVAAILGDIRAENALMRANSCFVLPETSFKNFKSDLCLHEYPAKTKTYLLVGDSHAADLWNALSQSMPDANVLQATTTPCRPYVHPRSGGNCKRMMDFVYQTWLPQHAIDGLLIASRWKTGESLKGLTETIDWAREHHVPVVLFGPVTEYEAALPRLLAYAIAWNLPALPSRRRDAAYRDLDARFQQMATDEWHIPYVSLYQAICEQGACTEYANDAQTIPLMSDDDHFTREGALLIVHRVLKLGEIPGWPPNLTSGSASASSR